MLQRWKLNEREREMRQTDRKIEKDFSTMFAYLTIPSWLTPVFSWIWFQQRQPLPECIPFSQGNPENRWLIVPIQADSWMNEYSTVNWNTFCTWIKANLWLNQSLSQSLSLPLKLLAVIWLKYFWCGIKSYSISHSILLTCLDKSALFESTSYL